VYPNIVKNPSFETALTGWNANGPGAVVARVAGGHHGSWCIEARGDSSLNSFGVNDAPNVVSQVAGAGARYRFSAWVRSASHTGKVQLKVREYLGGVQQGAQILSTPVTLGPTWQLVTMDAVATLAGSTLDFQVMNKPAVRREVFQVDDLTVFLVPPGAAALLASPGTGDSTTASTEPADATRAGSSLAFAARFYPNPPGRTATIDLVTTRTGFAQVRIFDAQGRLARTLLDEPALPAGRYELRFETRSPVPLGVGMYFYSVHTAEGRRSGKFAILD
jgi:hypothetical protein